MNSGCYNREGTTFVEVMIAILVLSVMSVGTLGYQYFAITNVETAKAEWVAVRMGQLVLEDWRSRGAMSGYDPSGLGMGFVQTDDDGGEYVITVDGVNMYLSLSYGDVEHDEAAQVTLRKISCVLQWRREHDGARDGDDGYSSITLSTYARIEG